MHAAQPSGRHERVHVAARSLVLDVIERGYVALVALERLEYRAQLEGSARAARHPMIHFCAVDRIPHDRAVRQIEEPGAQLRRRGSLRERRCRRNHRIE
jgi:hypothetical protein